MQSSIQTIRLRLISIVMGVFLFAGTTMALEADAATSSTDRPQGKVLFDVDFSGGSLTELAEFLEKKDSRVDIFVQPDAVDFPVPALSMRHVDMSACIWMLDHLTTTRENGDRGALMTETYMVPGGSQLVVLGNSFSGPVRSIASSRNDARNRARRAVEEPVRKTLIETSSIGYLLTRGVSAAMVLENIKSMQSLGPEQASQARVLISEASAVIMVKGSRSQIDQIWGLLEAMEDSTRYKSEVMPKVAGDIEKTLQDKNECGVPVMELEQLEALSMNQLRERVKELSTLAKVKRGQKDCQELIKTQFMSSMEVLKQKTAGE